MIYPHTAIPGQWLGGHQYKKILRNARKEYYLEYLDPKLDQNSKYLFNYIKRLKKDSIGIEALYYNGKITTNPIEKAEALVKPYESVFSKEN